VAPGFLEEFDHDLQGRQQNRLGIQAHLHLDEAVLVEVEEGRVGALVAHATREDANRRHARDHELEGPHGVGLALGDEGAVRPPDLDVGVGQGALVFVGDHPAHDPHLLLCEHRGRRQGDHDTEKGDRRAHTISSEWESTPSCHDT